MEDRRWATNDYQAWKSITWDAGARRRTPVTQNTEG